MFNVSMNSPIGELTISASEIGVSSISIGVSTDLESNDICLKAKSQLEEYFKGSRKDFDVPLDLIGTDFEKSVWEYLINIPYGKTTYYGAIAEAVSSTKAVRAVGRANGKNPIPIIVPCHRVIGKDKSLVGYALGLENKRKLLNLESPRSYSEQLKLSF